MTKFVLKSLDFKIPNISIHEQPIVIGRSPVTGIVDRRLSKKHLKITPNPKKKELLVEVCGQNKSKLNECVLRHGQSQTAYPGDTIELSEDLHPNNILPNNKERLSVCPDLYLRKYSANFDETLYA